jgi:AcrR family transcriptional regulator
MHMLGEKHHLVSGRRGCAAVSPQFKAKPDDTRARIVETAEALFRRLGFAKTAVADIAAELKMSPANVYRFFASKNAIVEAICQRCLLEVEEKAWAVARSKAPAPERLERLFLEILAYHKENLLTAHRVNEIVVFAIEHMWDTIGAHKDVTRNIVELILRDGVEAGEFETLDLRATAELMMRAMVAFCHPMLVSQCLEEGHDLEAEARASIYFLLRAITPRR